MKPNAESMVFLRPYNVQQPDIHPPGTSQFQNFHPSPNYIHQDLSSIHPPGITTTNQSQPVHPVINYLPQQNLLPSMDLNFINSGQISFQPAGTSTSGNQIFQPSGSLSSPVNEGTQNTRPVSFQPGGTSSSGNRTIQPSGS